MPWLVGIYQIDGDTLKIALNNARENRPVSLDEALLAYTSALSANSHQFYQRLSLEIYWLSGQGEVLYTYSPCHLDGESQR